MPIYHRLGQIPPKRHTQLRKPGDGGLYYEELFGTIGFEGMSSLIYHHHRPTQVKALKPAYDVAPRVAVANNLTMRRLVGFNIPPSADYLESRVCLLVNQDLQIGLAAPLQRPMAYFYKNADADELLFVHQGTGRLTSLFGELPFVPGDYLLIPRGVIYQISFDTDHNRLLYLESHAPIYTPKRYRNYFGQLQEQAPFCERDYILPRNLVAYDGPGDFLVNVKKGHYIHPLVYATHPFDAVGWDGYNYPWGFSIHNFEPITGRIHQPPPVHQTFETAACVVCSFCPRLYDYHPLSIPAPYNHSNIDSDEVLYYVDGEFMSRNDIAAGDMTLHPGGIPHGPHPGAYERSIGQKATQELAVMIDTFRPLMLTEAAMGVDDGLYFKSWLDR
ncbi:homogentisate 1,2-dioxygenase [Dyadobacter jejuensis]|uniref:Homogentisate 1,2-dioxygenase n=1 Tax=Dyadobacter jejuensis TaxID=1082580 RepID=A0A316AR55_9BACT|nr:homogentisate 1,2-dioxygenase [Dyadobacter jejuensis]PWJ59998.1 homogentisate 1,2-dioxygenase [Dyadobacter jejuensis]